jgi:hypothetical protein
VTISNVPVGPVGLGVSGVSGFAAVLGTSLLTLFAAL